ncbi:hypothetical protein D9758_013543 [Tetrapyrgos nigripes]|uniref:F-box domain-containing protein n=1 Tax=Tetrapyrgos nigripes TaxID=182062 RepID=A0A8H5FKD6_9AGAR|nr:hypothetical protein D9758_013543 [Tetrapyrgos nigripes]
MTWGKQGAPESSTSVDPGNNLYLKPLDSMDSLGEFAAYLSDRRVQQPILIPPHSATSLQSTLQDREARIQSDLIAQEESGKQVQRIEQQQRTIAKDLLSPLPPEVLEEIFFQYLQLREPEQRRLRLRRGRNKGHHYDRILPVVLLCNICSSWRYIVHGAPRLWTLLLLSPYNDRAPPAALIAEWLQRSGSLLVDLAICPFVPTNDDEWASYGDVLVSVGKRLHSLEVPIVLLKNAAEQLERMSLPNLRHTRILPKTDHSADGVIDLRHLLFFKTATRIRIVEFGGYTTPGDVRTFLDFPFPTARITRISMMCFSVGLPMLQDIIRACPLLEDCALFCITRLPTQPRNLPLFELPHLHCIRLQFQGAHGVKHLFDGLRLPALKVLRLSIQMHLPPASSEEVLPHLSALHGRSAFKLQDLTLLGIGANETDNILDFLGRIPTLESLSLEDAPLSIPRFFRALRDDGNQEQVWEASAVEERIATTPAPIILPNLTKLSVVKHFRADPASLEWDPISSSDIDIADAVASRCPGAVVDDIETHRITSRPVTKRLRSFTFQAYERDLSEDAMSILMECRKKGLQLKISPIPNFPGSSSS